MTRRRQRVVLAIVCFVSAFGAFARGAPPTDRLVRTSPEMPLHEIALALEAYGPNCGNVEARHDIFRSLDRQIDIRIHRDVELTTADRHRLESLIAFYRARVDRGLKRLESTRVTEGVLAVKFYSSSYALRSPEGTVLIDFCQGPVSSSEGDPETEDAFSCGFYWTKEQRRRLARQVDVSLITHRHHDHCDYSLTRLLLESGKPVVAPAQVARQWKELLPGVRAAKYGQVQRLGLVEILTFPGCQFSRNELGSDGQRRGVANDASPASDSETVVYLVRIGDATVLQAAENHIPYEHFLSDAAKRGWEPNVVLSAGQWQGASSVASMLGGVFRLSVHEYEMTHEGGGNRMAYRLEGGYLQRYLRKQQLPLLWGEGALLTPEILGR